MNVVHLRRLVSFAVFVFTFGRIVNESTTTTTIPTTTVRGELLSNGSIGNLSSAGDVCELNSSCTTPSNENATGEKKGPEKWHYNVSRQTDDNETTDAIHSVRESNGNSDGLSFEIDVTKVTYNRSASSNESTKPVVVKYQIQLEDDCFCDIMKGGCDLNCCCDEDCLYVNRNVFQECNKSTTLANEDSTCIAKVLDSPLLCIVKDNLYSRHFYPQYKSTPEIAQIDKLMTNRELFGWTILPTFAEELTNEDEPLPENIYKEYELGSPLLIVNDRGLRIFHLPRSTLTSRDCDLRKPVGFLENFQTVCTRRLSADLVAECESDNSVFNANVYFKNISVVTNPVLINDSFKLDCVHNCVNVVPYICDTEDISKCLRKNETTMRPLFSADSRNVCERAITGVRYHFLHNGTDGVFAAKVFLLQQNVTLKAKSLWAMKFAAHYEWLNQNETYELSGYPGYVSGKPVISGFKVAVSSPNENRTRYAINMDHRRERWLTMFSTEVDGSCSERRRRNILFEHNVYAQCSMRIAKVESVQQCEQLQKKILNTMFGDYVNHTNVLIAAQGAPDIHEPSNWIPLVSHLEYATDSANGTCSEIVTSVKLIILYSAVGDYENPVQTVIAAKLNGTSIGRNLSNYDQLRVTIAVNFYDVTSPPLRIFAEPPTYEIKLPTDFFYPFFSTARQYEAVGYRIWLLALLAMKLLVM